MKRICSRKLWVCMAVFVVLALLIGAAAGIFNTSEKKKMVYKLVLIPKTIDETNGFWTALMEGAKLGAEEYGAELTVVSGRNEEDYEGQNKRIEESIQKKPDAILVAPCSYSENTEMLQKVVDSGIKLVLVDSVIDKDIGQKVVGTDNYLAGVELGKYTQTLLTGESQIGMVGHVEGASTAIERERGMRNGLGEYEALVKQVVFCGSSYDKAYDLTKTMVEENPKIDVIMGMNEYSAVGAARAIRDLELKNKVQVVGFDNSIEEIQLMEAGIFKGIIIQKPFNMGYLGVEQAVKLVQGREVEDNLDSGCKMITMENLYEEKNQRLLYPFSGKQ